MGPKRLILIGIILFFFIFPCFSLNAQTATGLRITQAALSGQDLRVYFQLFQEDGQTVQVLDANNVQTFLGSQVLPVVNVETVVPEQGITYYLLVDVSKSLENQSFDNMKNGMKELLAGMKAEDGVILITFGDKVQVAQDFTKDKTVVKEKIDGLKITDNQTLLYDALLKATDLARQEGAKRPERKVIVTLSDGLDDSVGGLTKDEILQELHVQHIPIYAIGYSEGPLSNQKKEGLQNLGEAARASGGEFFASGSDFRKAYEQLKTRVNQGFLLTTKLPFSGDGQLYRLQITLQTDNKKLTDSIDLRLLAAQNESTTQEDQNWRKYELWLLLIGIALLIILGMILWFYRKRKKTFCRSFTKPLNPQSESVIQTEPSQKTDSIPLRLILLGKYDRSQFQANLQNRLIIGRDNQQCQVILQDEEVSAKHCEIYREKQLLMVRDLGSKNGTYVNGVAVDQYRLQSGDILSVGRSELRIIFGE